MAQICNKLIVKLIYLFHAYLHFNRQQINIFIPLSTFLLRQEEKVSEGKTWDPSIKCKCSYIFQPFPSLRRLHCTAQLWRGVRWCPLQWRPAHWHTGTLAQHRTDTNDWISYLRWQAWCSGIGQECYHIYSRHVTLHLGDRRCRNEKF